MRPATSGCSWMDCIASICPVAAMASTTVSRIAAETSTGMGGIPPPAPGPPGDADFAFLQAARSTTNTTIERSDIITGFPYR